MGAATSVVYARWGSRCLTSVFVAAASGLSFPAPAPARSDVNAATAVM